jgi:serine phosphatase RsbU (regulator of sigma subunit)
VQYAVMPARNFSGDVVAVARSPDGALYAMLADATGHGLAAAVSVLPALGAFYRGAARNVPLEVLATELNDLLCGLLPPGHFVASALVRLEAARQEGRIWVGGVPDVLLLDDHGQVATAFLLPPAPPRHPAVSGRGRGVRSFPVGGSGPDRLCSDGLTEAENSAGQAFGRAGLEQVLQATSRASRLIGLRQALTRHLAGQAATDDVSVLILDCEVQAGA